MPLHIAIIEDDPLLREALELVLEMDGFAVQSLVEPYAGAVAKVAQTMPDVILLDLHLPDIDGEELLQRLQQDPRTAPIPVIMTSADLFRLPNVAGVAAYALPKPYTVQELFAAIEQVRH